MASPGITFSHVNSIHIRTYRVDPYAQVGTDYELGWAWDYDRAKPYWFRFVIENGRVKTPTTPNYTVNQGNGVQVLVDPAKPKNNNALWLYGESGRIVFRIDSTQFTWYWPDSAGTSYMHEGLVVWGSERENTNESNFGHFWALGKRNHVGG